MRVCKIEKVGLEGEGFGGMEARTEKCLARRTRRHGEGGVVEGLGGEGGVVEGLGGEGLAEKVRIKTKNDKYKTYD